MNTARAVVKSVLERLVAVSAAPVIRAWYRDQILIIAYHNIVPEGESPCGDRSLHLSQRAFSRQLDILCATHDVVALSQVLTVVDSSARPRAAITFDDAYTGALTAGLAELKRRSLPATFFVVPAYVGGSPFWWDEFADPRSGELEPRFRDRALEECAGIHERVSAMAVEQGKAAASLPPHARAATEEQLEAAAATPGITLASHTWSHANLPHLDEAQLAAELIRPMQWLRARWPQTLPWLSYPYGNCSPAVARAAAAAGYAGALLVSGGWLPRHIDPSRHALPRLNIPAGLSLDGFVLRTSGIGAR